MQHRKRFAMAAANAPISMKEALTVRLRCFSGSFGCWGDSSCAMFRVIFLAADFLRGWFFEGFFRRFFEFFVGVG